MKRVYEWLETLTPPRLEVSVPAIANKHGHGNIPEKSDCFSTVGEGEHEGQDLDLDQAEEPYEGANPEDTLMGVGSWIEEEQGPNENDSQLFEIK